MKTIIVHAERDEVKNSQKQYKEGKFTSIAKEDLRL